MRENILGQKEAVKKDEKSDIPAPVCGGRRRLKSKKSRGLIRASKGFIKLGNIAHLNLASKDFGVSLDLMALEKERR